jgi:putative transposase
MPRGRPRTFDLTLSEETRIQLEGIAGSRSLPAGLVRRARVILLSASGLANRDVVEEVGLSQVMVGHWRRRDFSSRSFNELPPGCVPPK